MSQDTTQSFTAYLPILPAIATFCIAILAIWGDWFRAKLAPPKLKIESHNLRGNLVKYGDGRNAIFYHLKVVNHRRWIAVKNCRVQLVSVFRRGPDQQFRQVHLSYPIQLSWVPAEFSPLFETITHERIFDLGFIVENVHFFQPRIIYEPSNFEGKIAPNEACRYSLQIVADNYISPIQVFEVSWDGTFNYSLDKMENSLIIKEVVAATRQ